MTDSAGINAGTGNALTDWEHTQQSIGKILTTPIGSRVMRRTFGSNLPDLIDAKLTPANVLRVYSASAEAIIKWEPRFRMSAGRVLRAGYAEIVGSKAKTASPGGVLSLEIYGTYYPRGHLGDYSIAQSATARVVFER